MTMCVQPSEASHCDRSRSAFVVVLTVRTSRLIVPSTTWAQARHHHVLMHIKSGAMRIQNFHVLPPSQHAAGSGSRRWKSRKRAPRPNPALGAMSGLAAGDTSIDVPGRDRSDEIGRMADALGVFRDAAIELQKSNQREIREGRRRLAVAIESISEAFSLYDREDRLIVCNNKYRTLLYPGSGAEIVPGMAFESIIQRAAERGYIKDAEGRVEQWVRERMIRHREPSGPHIQQRGDG